MTSRPVAMARTVPALGLVGVALLTALSLTLRPPGLFAAVIGVALVCPWQGWVAQRLEAAGLSTKVRRFTGVAVLLVAAATNLALGGQLDGHLLYGGDYHTYYIGALVGAQHGWGNLFDIHLQSHAWQASPGATFEFLPYLNTPPTAWVVVPLLPLAYASGYYTFIAVMLAIGVTVGWMVAPATGRGRLLLLLVCAATWEVVSSFAEGQNIMVGVLAIALCWRLLVAQRRVLAGLALAVITLRPNATFLVPLALLVAGERRVFLAWLGATTAIGLAVLASLGPHGVQQFVELAVFVRRTHPAAVLLSLQHVIGAGLFAWALQLILGLAAAVYGARRARGNAAMVICAGLLGSLLLSPYMHFQDFLPPLAILAILVIHDRSQGAMVILLLMLAVAPPGWAYADAWPLAFIAVELVWLSWLLLRGREIHRKFPVGPQNRHRVLGQA